MEIWQRQTAEPAKWYERFEAYRQLGPKRNIDKAYRIRAQIEGLRGNRPGANWANTAKKWQWQSRAEAWDESERNQLRAAEAARRFDARQDRLRHIETIQTLSFHLLQQALQNYNLPKLNPNPTPAQISAMSEAIIELMPNLRRIFVDMLKHQRLEFGEATEVIANNNNANPIDDIHQMLNKVYGSNTPS